MPPNWRCLIPLPCRLGVFQKPDHHGAAAPAICTALSKEGMWSSVNLSDPPYTLGSRDSQLPRGTFVLVHGLVSAARESWFPELALQLPSVWRFSCWSRNVCTSTANWLSTELSVLPSWLLGPALSFYKISDRMRIQGICSPEGEGDMWELKVVA